MSNAFKDKKAKVVAVEPSASSRTLMIESIKSCGFADVTGVSSLKEAIGLLEVDPVDWILTPLFASQPINALSFLRLCHSQLEIRNVNLTVIISEDEKEFLNAAYQNGLVSHLNKPFTKDSLGEELTAFLKKYEEFSWDRTYIAAEYLRFHLTESNQWQELLNFERHMLQVFPSREDLLFNLIEPLVKINQHTQARSVLNQIKIILPDRIKQVKQYDKKFFTSEILDTEDAPPINILNIQKALVIDNDDAVRSHIVTHLKEMGVPAVEAFDSGLDAFDYLTQNDDVEIIIQEWHLPKISGPLFIQKLNEINKQHLPIIILSSLVKQEDLPFIREFGVANVMEKPFEKQNFTKTLIWTIQQERVPTEVSMMERKMRNLLRFNERNEAEQIRPRFNSHPNVNIGKRQMIDAEFALFDKDYTKTRDLCLMAIKNHGDTLLLFSLLGRAMMHLKEFDYALKCFERAKSMAPQNIERLCQIAEIKSEIGDHSTATKLLEDAKGIDRSSEFIKESEAKVALNSGDPAKAKIIMNHVRAVENVVSYMNNQAVAMARCNMIDESVSRYRQTILAIPDNRPDMKASVLYNLGLAMVRSEKLAEAIPHLEEATKLTNTSIKRKARSLLRRVRKAISSNSEVTILSIKEHNILKSKAAKDANKEDLTEEDSGRRLLGIVDLMPGDFACYQIFKPLIVDEKSLEMLLKIPHFKTRKTIKKDSTGGVERMMKQSSKAG